MNGLWAQVAIFTMAFVYLFHREIRAGVRTVVVRVRNSSRQGQTGHHASRVYNRHLG